MAKVVLRLVCPPGVHHHQVEIVTSKFSYAGMAQPWRNSVRLRVGTARRFPTSHRPARKGVGYLPVPPLASPIEALVYVAAHELRHLWQHDHTAGKVWGARGQYSERDADAYAIRMLRKWRREAPPLAPAKPRIRLLTADQVEAEETQARKLADRQKKHERTLAREKAWTTRLRRAQTALKKLKRQRSYYERAAPPIARAAKTP